MFLSLAFISATMLQSSIWMIVCLGLAGYIIYDKVTGKSGTVVDSLARQAFAAAIAAHKSDLGPFGPILQAIATGDRAALAGEIQYLSRQMAEGKGIETTLESFIETQINKRIADPVLRGKLIERIHQATGPMLTPNIAGVAPPAA